MSNIIINDLPVNSTLDSKALASVVGGSYQMGGYQYGSSYCYPQPYPCYPTGWYAPSLEIKASEFFNENTHFTFDHSLTKSSDLFIKQVGSPV